ncbi:DDE superfamily endonuclease domain [Trinorchestia longiramus]|nr:DDE superfamily endonuclease domain [Trinorchestia longiramus]
MYNCFNESCGTGSLRSSPSLYDTTAYESTCGSDGSRDVHSLQPCHSSNNFTTLQSADGNLYNVLGDSSVEISGLPAVNSQTIICGSELHDADSASALAVDPNSVSTHTNSVIGASVGVALDASHSADDASIATKQDIRDQFVQNATEPKRRKRFTLKGRSYALERSSLRRSCNQTENYQTEDNQLNDGSKQKRRRLSLEVKVDIVKRVMGGEKQRNLAEEYNLNLNTIKTIVKNSSKYLQCWNEGAFTPHTKRLKGPKREDLERVLSHWYHKMTESNSGPVTGTQLCSKAMDIAARLGHSDFKASHGWLDRFKRRNGIIFGKTSTSKEASEHAQADHQLPEASPLGDALLYQDPSNVFTLQEVGIFYKALPRYAMSLTGNRCAGGLKANERFTILMCANAIGSEKFPLLVVGAVPKTQYRQLVPDSPVQYIYDPDSWLTKESVFAWLLDLDDWFSQHRRKVVMIVSDLPVQQGNKRRNFNALSVYQLRPSSTLPLRSTVVPTFKLLYRQGLLNEFLKMKVKTPRSNSDDRNNVKLPLHNYITLLGKAWEYISDSEIIDGFRKNGLNRYSGWLANNPSDLTAKSKPELLEEYKIREQFTNNCTMDDYVNFDTSLQVCDELTVDDMIAQVLVGKEPLDDRDLREHLESGEEVERHLHVLREYVALVNQPDLSSVFLQFQDLLKSVS